MLFENHPLPQASSTVNFSELTTLARPAFLLLTAVRSPFTGCQMSSVFIPSPTANWRLQNPTIFTDMIASTNRSETQAHRELKRLALLWAQQNGFRIAASEVSLPQHSVRMDVAAYKPETIRFLQKADSLHRRRTVLKSAVGVSVIFECKASRADFIRDAHCMDATAERLKVLHARKTAIEEELRIFYPSIRNGDSLFPEFETLNFERPGYERYTKILAEFRQLSTRLHTNTKFDRLIKHGAANLFYLVANGGIFDAHEVPAGWGLLQRAGEGLNVITRPVWHDVAEDERLNFLHRIALAATRAVNREHEVEFSPYVRGT
jgi:hypothetical protein